MPNQFYSNPGIKAPDYNTNLPPELQGAFQMRDRMAAEEMLGYLMQQSQMDLQRQQQDLSEYMYGAPARLNQLDLQHTQGILSNRHARQDLAVQTSPEFLQQRGQDQQNQMSLQLQQNLGKLDAAKQQRVLQEALTLSNTFGPAVQMYQKYKQLMAEDGIQGLALKYQLKEFVNKTAQQLKSKGIDVADFDNFDVDRDMPQLEAMHQSAVLSVPILQELVKIQAQGNNAMNVTGLEGEYSLKRQNLANQGALRVAQAKNDDEAADELTQPPKVVGRILLRLGKGEKVTTKELGIARGHLEAEWKKQNRIAAMNLGFMSGMRGDGLTTFVDNMMRRELSSAYPDLYAGVQIETPQLNPAATESQSVGEIVERGGKKWRIVGFDKDGEPLVEPVQ